MAEVHLPDHIYEALDNVLNYMWSAEERNYAEHPSERHIFLDMKTLRGWAWPPDAEGEDDEE